VKGGKEFGKQRRLREQERASPGFEVPLDQVSVAVDETCGCLRAIEGDLEGRARIKYGGHRGAHVHKGALVARRQGHAKALGFLFLVGGTGRFGGGFEGFLGGFEGGFGFLWTREGLGRRRRKRRPQSRTRIAKIHERSFEK